MICPNCGREIPDGTICPCTLEQQPALSDNPALNALKSVGSSTLFLVMAVLFSVSALLTVFSSLGTSSAMSNIYVYAYQMGLGSEQVEAIMDAMRSTSVFSVVLGATPAILTAAAMWIHFSTCMSRKSGNISTAGLTICKVLAYIGLVGLCVCAGLVLICFALIIIAFLMGGMSDFLGAYGSYYSYGGSYSDEEATIAVVVVLCVFALIIAFVMGLAIAYQASMIRMINRTKSVAATGLADDRVSGYLTGMTGFTAACTLISGFITLFASPLAGGAGIAQGVALILMIVLLRRYHNAMNQVLYPPVPPVMPPIGYPGQQYAAPQVPQAPGQQYSAPPQQPQPPQQPPQE